MPSPVSFTVRRPTPVSRPSSSGPESDGSFKVPALPRHLASPSGSATGSPLAGSPRTFSSREDSDDDEETGIVFASGAGTDNKVGHHTDSSDEEDFVAHAERPGDDQRLRRKTKKPSGQDAPLVIPSRSNPDWREAARRRRAACSRVQSTARAAPSFVPNSALATTGADGSVGGLGTRDTINGGPQLSGLQLNKKIKLEADKAEAVIVDTAATATVVHSTGKVVGETEDQRALRAILAGEGGPAPAIEVIPVPSLSEADALRQDVEELPDVATADAYERVPISAFGAAMLRGMGWTDGAVAPKSDKRGKNSLRELYLPQARPALLGIGAKEREAEDDGSEKKKSKRPDMRYVPVARRESGDGEDGSSRGPRRSRPPNARHQDDISASTSRR